jgi:hypothetical protein
MLMPRPPIKPSQAASEPRRSGPRSCAGLRGVKLVVSDAHEGIKAEARCNKPRDSNCHWMKIQWQVTSRDSIALPNYPRCSATAFRHPPARHALTETPRPSPPRTAQASPPNQAVRRARSHAGRNMAVTSTSRKSARAHQQQPSAAGWSCSRRR